MNIMLFPSKQTSKPKNFLRNQTHKKPKKFQLKNKIIKIQKIIQTQKSNTEKSNLHHIKHEQEIKHEHIKHLNKKKTHKI